MAKVYKIQRGKLFSSGQLQPKWTRLGKLFETRQGLLNHLKLVDQNCMKKGISWPYVDCQVKTFTRYLKSGSSRDLEEFFIREVVSHGMLLIPGVDVTPSPDLP